VGGVQAMQVVRDNVTNADVVVVSSVSGVLFLRDGQNQTEFVENIPGGIVHKLRFAKGTGTDTMLVHTMGNTLQLWQRPGRELPHLRAWKKDDIVLNDPDDLCVDLTLSYVVYAKRRADEEIHVLSTGSGELHHTISIPGLYTSIGASVPLLKHVVDLALDTHSKCGQTTLWIHATKPRPPFTYYDSYLVRYGIEEKKMQDSRPQTLRGEFTHLLQTASKLVLISAGAENTSAQVRPLNQLTNVLRSLQMAAGGHSNFALSPFNANQRQKLMAVRAEPPAIRFWDLENGSETQIV
jgi:hypothetical protein